MNIDDEDAVFGAFAPLAIPAEDAVLVQRRLLRYQGQYSVALAFGSTALPFPEYPYTKGPDLANDGIGYGELVTVKSYRLDAKGVLTGREGVSRRTRSGRQIVADQPVPADAHPADGPQQNSEE